MFDRCITCERLGQDCAPNLLSLPWPDLMAWWKKRQAFLDWTNQTLSDKSNIPVGTINRIKAGEDDCRYSTMRSIIHALMGGHSVEFPCQKKLDQEFAHYEDLEKQCNELTGVNGELVAKIRAAEEMLKTAEANLHGTQKDLDHARALHEEAHKQVAYLLDLVAKLRADNDNLWAENKRKSIIVDKYFESQLKGS